ncbi:hypothetical protein BDE36_1317 [Arcticibacter tournemirensis]|uniref:Uncharacterized protein n=1 Tax=Arcticibacter tournemirensis TaxID=699437 RepID=A0A5M9GVJ7_9SPHI|nr:hypothetical protein [Arcticibacter tournemirensis]KAA8476834.1 hypothetical protein F1649_19345 [Arcticibacter tournemirensis]TQM49598.1 hypothetical protein BDE36_1317 [Arcticibacter tournemirensis]
MFPLTDTGPPALDPGVLAFFMNRIAVQGQVFLFSYQDQQGGTATEYWSSGLHLVPAFAGTWLVHEGFPAQVRHLFLSHSAADILCFCQLRPDWLTVPGNVAFAALGLLATASQARFLKERFANAKVHTLFDAGLTGRVTDCKIALWRAGKDAAFRVMDDTVQITYRRRKFNIPVSAFSLHRFEKAVALRSNIRTHKPKGCFGSYHEFFVDT